MNQIEKIVIIDLWTDANRGDNALQVGLLKMLRDTYNRAILFGVFRFGINEIKQALPEIEGTVGHLDGYYGGLRRTSYAGKRATANVCYRKLHGLLSFVELFWLIFLYKFRLRFLVPATHKTVMKLLESADLVVWKGKNFREYHGFSGIHRQITLNIAGIIARLFSRNVICVNASFWKICNPVQRCIIRFAFNACSKVTVRDQTSVENFEAITGVQPDYCVDLSFYDIYDRLKAVDRRSIQKKYDLAVTVTSWGSTAEKEKYIDMLVAIIGHLVAETPNARIVIVPQVVRVAENSGPEVKRLVNRVGGQYFEHMAGPLDIYQLLDVYAQSKKLIGTRMHSCVFAACVGTPFLAIAYDAGPKWEILLDVAPKDCIVNYSQIEELDPKIVLDRVRLLDFNLKDLAAKAKQNVNG